MDFLPDIGSSLPEVILRTAVVYLFLVVVLRISGKREVGQLSVLELVVILVISDAVQNSMVGENTTLWGGLVAVLTLLGLDIALKWADGAVARVCAVSSRASRACSSATASSSRRRCARRGVDAEEVRRAVRRPGPRPGRRRAAGGPRDGRHDLASSPRTD